MYFGCDMGYKMAENDLRNYEANKANGTGFVQHWATPPYADVFKK